MNDLLQSSKMDSLATLVEEVARSTQEGVKRFVEPASGTLRRATNKRHHIVFGRRGSGKTSLLRKAAADLTIDRRPIAFVDLETFKGHAYPDVLISVLIASFNSFKEWLDTAAVHPATRTTFWERLFGTKPKKPAFNRKMTEELSTELSRIIRELKELLHLADNAQLQKISTSDQERASQGELTGEIGVSQAARVASRVSEAETTSTGQEIQESYQRSKIDYLHRHILDYQNLFKELSKLSEGDSFLFLDDLYHIPRVDQPRLLDYFHRIAKGNSLWLKVGTIKHRSRWYIHGDPPVGLNLGDDADDIDLDLTLEQYPRTKQFLVKILQGLVAECSVSPLSEFLADGAIDRLVLASGGVARDFLGIFRRSIDEARERLQSEPKHYRGSKIGAEDVNLAAGKSGETKMADFRTDTLQEDHPNLEEAFERIRNFCTARANANCFLLNQDIKGKEIDLIDELVDLRLIHLVRSGVTVRGRTGKVYKAYMLDVSQYAAWRKRRGLKLVEFWRKGARESLRSTSFIYDPFDTQLHELTEQDLFPKTSSKAPSIKDKAKNGDDLQIPLPGI